MRLYGSGLPKDYRKAAQHLRKAAEFNEGGADIDVLGTTMLAQLELAQLYRMGWGVEKSGTLSQSWFRKHQVTQLEGLQATDEELAKIVRRLVSHSWSRSLFAAASAETKRAVAFEFLEPIRRAPKPNLHTLGGIEMKDLFQSEVHEFSSKGT